MLTVSRMGSPITYNIKCKKKKDENNNNNNNNKKTTSQGEGEGIWMREGIKVQVLSRSNFA